MSQQSDDGYNDNPITDYNEHGLAGLERDRERDNKPTPPAPNPETWLQQNDQARNLVEQGLKNARDRKFVPSPVSKPSEFWFHIDDARTAEECADRSENWQPYVERSAYDAVVKELDRYTAEVDKERDAALAKLAELEVKYNERGMAMRETGDMVRSLYEPRIKRLEAALAYAKRWITPGNWTDDAGNKKNPRLEIERLERGK